MLLSAAVGRSEQQEPEKKSLAETLQCPVCYELPIPPVFGCQNGHIICNSCKDLVQHCPVCRAEKFNVRNVIIEDILTSSTFPCPFRDEGCRMPSMNGVDYSAHVKICDYRQIECHCKLGGEECHGQLFSKDEYLEHMMDSHGSRPGRGVHIVKCDMAGPFSPTYFSYLGMEFILMSHKEGTKFWTWVAVDECAHGHSHARHAHAHRRHSHHYLNENSGIQFYVKLSLRYYSGRVEYTCPSEMVPAQSLRNTPAQVLKSGHCLEFSAATIPATMPPYVWPGYVEEDDEECGFVWGYDVEIHQAQTLNRLSVPKKRTNRPTLGAAIDLTRTLPIAAILSPDNPNPVVAQNALQGDLVAQLHREVNNPDVFANELDDYDLNEDWTFHENVANVVNAVPPVDGVPVENIFQPTDGVQPVNLNAIPPVDGGPDENNLQPTNGVPPLNRNGIPPVDPAEEVFLPGDVDPAGIPENDSESLSDEEDDEDDDDEDDDDDDDDEENVDEAVPNTVGRGTIRPAPTGDQNPQPAKMPRGVMQPQTVEDLDTDNDDIVDIANNSLHEVTENENLDADPTD